MVNVVMPKLFVIIVMLTVFSSSTICRFTVCLSLASDNLHFFYTIVEC